MKKKIILFLIMLTIFSAPILSDTKAFAISESAANKKVDINFSNMSSMVGYLDSRAIIIIVNNRSSKPIYIQKSGNYYDDFYPRFNRKLTLHEKKKKYYKVKPKTEEVIGFLANKPLSLDKEDGYVGIKYKYGNNKKKTKTFIQYGGVHFFY
ncbi:MULTISPECIES: hypothetical protein [Kurthia]|uniref:hypothetical protein n=1 Tax=Kurthia TaxID=1649 RepID=UPI002DB7DEF3|nr:hypothetical protein [Kurthia gibsonii]MEB7772098.1 hypothetical protein [Kurthia gibsonii]